MTLCVARTCTRRAVQNNRCERHKTKQWQRTWERPARWFMYHDKRWKQLRRRKLRESPYCAVHEAKGQAIIATDVDHIVPHKGDGSLFFDYGNLQSLCHSCHSMKTGQERRDGSLEIDE